MRISEVPSINGAQVATKGDADDGQRERIESELKEKRAYTWSESVCVFEHLERNIESLGGREWE